MERGGAPGKVAGQPDQVERAVLDTAAGKGQHGEGGVGDEGESETDGEESVGRRAGAGGGEEPHGDAEQEDVGDRIGDRDETLHVRE